MAGFYRSKGVLQIGKGRCHPGAILARFDSMIDAQCDRLLMSTVAIMTLSV